MKPKQTPNTQTQDWQKLLIAWKHSSLSGTEFCKQRNLAYHQFVYWKQKLSKPTIQPDQQTQSAFVKIEPLVPTPNPTPISESLTITLPGGILIQGVSDTNIALVRQLMEVR